MNIVLNAHFIICFVHICKPFSRIQVTCWLRKHIGFSSRIPKIMWFLGVVAWGPTPSSHMRHPVDPLLWRSARELIVGFSPTLQRRIFLGSSVLPSIFPFHYPFSHFTFIPLLFSVVHTCCPSAVFVVPMQSSFSVRNMDSTPEPPSPNMAAAAPANRKFRKCSHCPSRMPSFAFDNHTLCTKCRNQVCDMELVCDECRDWPPQKCKVFVNYNNSLRARREYKQRKARLAGAASNQSVYDTDTDVPLDEPSVPVQNVQFDTVGQQLPSFRRSGSFRGPLHGGGSVRCFGSFVG